MPILVGTDGLRKMSKTLGNQIGVTDPPEEMYGKTMSIPDSAMSEYYRLLLGRQPPAGAAAGASAARDAKRALAFALVAWLHSDADAERAQAHFDRVIGEGQHPEEVDEASFTCQDGHVHLPALIADAFGLSRSEARRLIDQGGVALGERNLAAGEHDLPCDDVDGEILRVGRRRFVRLRLG